MLTHVEMGVDFTIEVGTSLMLSSQIDAPCDRCDALLNLAEWNGLRTTVSDHARRDGQAAGIGGVIVSVMVLTAERVAH